MMADNVKISHSISNNHQKDLDLLKFAQFNNPKGQRNMGRTTGIWQVKLQNTWTIEQAFGDNSPLIKWREEEWGWEEGEGQWQRRRE
jgi:hypothetical protein